MSVEFYPPPHSRHIFERPQYSITLCVFYLVFLGMSLGRSVTPPPLPPERAFQLTLCVDKRRNVCGLETCIAKSIFSSFLQYCWPRSVSSLFHGLYHCCPSSTHCCCCVVSTQELFINIIRMTVLLTTLHFMRRV